ncbi:MAG: zf-HC2 domain-containing protein [Desertimonas sp.]
MECERWREALSADLDGEASMIDDRLLRAHLRRCPDCRQFAEQARRLHAPMRIATADTMPDLSRRVRRLNALADRAAAWSVVRALLGVVAIQILAASIPAILSAPDADSSSHVNRHLGAFAAAYGVGLLLVTLRPARARTLVPVAAVVAGGLLITAVFDLFAGRVPLRGEILHVPEIISVVLLWLMANPRRARGTRQHRAALRSTPAPAVEREVG